MKTNYLKEKILKHVTGEATFTKPTNTYVGLLTADPTVAGLTTNEVAGGSYARQPSTFTYDSVSKTSKNASAVFFDNMPAATVRYWAVFDASTGGNMLIYEPIIGELQSVVGLDLNVAPGNLIYRES